MIETKIRNIIALIIAVAILLSVTVSITSGENQNIYEEVTKENQAETFPLVLEESKIIPGMDKVYENEYLELYLNTETTEIAVRNRETKAIWYSNPHDRKEDPIASSIPAQRLASQLTVHYSTPAGTQRTMNNRTDSVLHEQFEIAGLENGIRITYTIGKLEEVFLVPRVISKERFESLILDNIEDQQDVDTLMRRYTLLSLEDATGESHREQMLEEYPSLVDNDIYRIPGTTAGHVMATLDSIIRKTGYNFDDMEYDNIENHVPFQEPNREVFVIPLEYYIEGKNLMVRIPTWEIESDAFIRKEDGSLEFRTRSRGVYALNRIEVLEFFGAAGTESEGYIFIPDGSGSLVYLNNGKNSVAYRPYSRDVYGRDNAVERDERNDYTDNIYLPVYGLKKDNSAFFAIIEQGDAMARIHADVSGRQNSYNNVHSSFNILPRDELSLQDVGSKAVDVFQSRFTRDDIVIRYGFLFDDDANYMGMANKYRNFLEENGKLNKSEFKDDLPFFLELFGAARLKKSVMGMPVEILHPLTDYKQAQYILDEFKQAGIDNIKFKYTGWFNGGINHSYASDISLERKLGGQRGFEDLLEYIRINNIDFYPDVDFMYVYRTNLFDGFFARTHASRFLTRGVAEIFNYNPATYLPDRQKISRHLLSPSRYDKLTDSFLKDFMSYETGGISLRSMGVDVNSDFRERKTVDRVESAEIIGMQMKKLTDKGLALMVSGGNAPTLEYADSIMNIPVNSNRFQITDACIPFFALVTRGFLEYCTQPFNLATNYRHNILASAETGAGISYSLMYEKNYVLKESEYNHLFSVNYSGHIQKAIELYQEFNEIFGPLQGEKIVGHEILDEKIHMTVFEGGKRIVVNYNNFPAEVMGINMDAESYKVIGGENK